MIVFEGNALKGCYNYTEKKGNKGNFVMLGKAPYDMKKILVSALTIKKPRLTQVLAKDFKKNYAASLMILPVVIYLVAIAVIDREQYESADIDGTNRFRRIRTLLSDTRIYYLYWQLEYLLI